MKQIYLSLFFAALFYVPLSAQSDTLFYEDFQTLQDSDLGIYPFGNDTTWISLDADGLTPNGGDPIENSWYHSYDFRRALVPGTQDTNIIINSFSWLDGFLPGNRNWLITPPITVSDASAVLHWQSATLQLPRYMDGYQVLISPTGNNDALGGMFTDTLFRAASMDSIIGNDQSIDPANFTFSPGYIHGDYKNTWADTSLWEYYIAESATLNYGLMEPHSVSLAAYAGKKIYIAFLHDSDDDFYLGIDNILVKGNTVGVKPEIALQNVQLYPNPATHLLNFNFTLTANAQQVSYFISQADGKKLLARQVGDMSAGQYFEQVAVDQLPAGAYNINISVNGTIVSQPFQKF
jgi:Cleaved Adhesin Domain